MYLSYLHILSIISVIQVSLSLFNNKNHVDLSDYWKSGTWDIIEVPAYLNVNNNTGEGGHSSSISCYLSIFRWCELRPLHRWALGSST